MKKSKQYEPHEAVEMSRTMGTTEKLLKYSGETGVSTGSREGGFTRLPSHVQLWLEVFFLILVGLIMIYSSSSMVALNRYGGDSAFFLKRHILWVVLGFGLMVVCSRIPYEKYKPLIGPLMIGMLAALTLLLIPSIGTEVNNARRWFRFGSFQVQPAEYVKVIWIIYLAVSITKKQDRIREFSIGYLTHFVMCGLVCALLLKQPDFGTTVILLFMTVVMLMVGGVPLLYLFSIVPIAVLGGYKFVYLVGYRWDRITAFLDPWTDHLASGYQLIQAWIAVGSGGIWGKGLGASHQKLYYLPEAHTDFILAVIGEELGFVGIVVICSLFGLFFHTGMTIARNAPDFLGSIMALGLTLLITIQALINMGVVLGLFPTKGLTLPFISYGGSAFTANCLAVGVLMNIGRQSERANQNNV